MSFDSITSEITSHRLFQPTTTMILRRQRRRRLRLMNTDAVNVLNGVSSSSASTLGPKVSKRNPRSPLPEIPITTEIDVDNTDMACVAIPDLDTASMEVNYDERVGYSVINEINSCSDDSPE